MAVDECGGSEGISADPHRYRRRARSAGLTPDSAQVQAIARRHDDWIAAGWQGGIPDANARTGLDEMYVADPRFAANYDKYGANTPEFVRDAMHACAEARQLS